MSFLCHLNQIRSSLFLFPFRYLVRGFLLCSSWICGSRSGRRQTGKSRLCFSGFYSLSIFIFCCGFVLDHIRIDSTTSLRNAGYISPITDIFQAYLQSGNISVWVSSVFDTESRIITSTRFCHQTNYNLIILNRLWYQNNVSFCVTHQNQQSF